MTPAKLQPALLAGVAIGVLSSLPVVNLANVCCCAWVIFGGGLAAYLMQQNHPAPIEAGDGALVGLLAGAFGGIATTVISIPIAMALGPFQAQLLEGMMERARDIPPEWRTLIEEMRTGARSGHHDGGRWARHGGCRQHLRADWRCDRRLDVPHQRSASATAIATR